jgi:cytochrome P450
MPPSFGPDYVEGAIKPFLLSAIYFGERPSLPMIDVALSKEKAIPAHIWGMLYDSWQPNLEEDGLSVFLQGYEHRGPDNARKRIYFSALTPDLYAPMYAPKVKPFFTQLFADRNARKPLMHQYYERYFDLYWDLHLGVSGEAIPAEVRHIGASFNTVIGFWFPTLEIVHQHYMHVRRLRQPLQAWVDQRVQAIIDGTVAHPEQTFVYYWIKNGELGATFRRKDIVFECFHNFLAFSQWGNTLYNIIARLQSVGGDPVVRAWFERTMQGAPDQPDGSAFTPLDRFVMELMRTISPNAASVSTLAVRQHFLGTGYSTILTPHPASSRNPSQWNNPDEFDPDRYTTATTSDQNDEAQCKAIGLARCPFSPTSVPVKDGRDVEVRNSAFGAVYSTVNGEVHPVLDVAGYAPFGFGYRRCPGESFTVEVLKEFLRTVWSERITFVPLDLQAAEQVPVGPATVVEDNIAFERMPAGGL